MLKARRVVIVVLIRTTDSVLCTVAGKTFLIALLLLLSNIMDGHCIDDEDLQLPNPEWKPSEWIGCGKAYNLKDLPRHVAIQLERARIVPPHIQSILPSEALSPAAFYAHTDVPAWYESAHSRIYLRLVRMVTALNTVSRKGISNINVMDLHDEDDVAT